MKRNAWLFLVCCVVSACAARTELGDLDAADEVDGSLPDVSVDVTLPDVSPPPDDVIVIDVSPPPDDVIVIDASPPPDDASVDVPIIDALPPPDAPDDVVVTSCPDNCSSNHECQQQCTPKLQSGRYCCDEQTATCYAWVGTFCPFIFDAGFD